jgi:hypothetical protein
MLKVMPPDVKPTDPDRIIGPMTDDFFHAMCGAFTGSEPLESTIATFSRFIECDSTHGVTAWLYRPWNE